MLPSNISRGLSDRSYEKRKQAALELEGVVKEMQPDQVRQLISNVVREFSLSPQSNLRKGGLIALAGISISLSGSSAEYLELLLPPILRAFTDPEARVRYYACEAMYNISKVSRSTVVIFFNELFDGLCRVRLSETFGN